MSRARCTQSTKAVIVSAELNGNPSAPAGCLPSGGWAPWADDIERLFFPSRYFTVQ